MPRVSVSCLSVAPADLSYPPQPNHDRGVEGNGVWTLGWCNAGKASRLSAEDRRRLWAAGRVWVCHFNTKPRSKKELFLSNISVILTLSSDEGIALSFQVEFGNENGRNWAADFILETETEEDKLGVRGDQK